MTELERIENQINALYNKLEYHQNKIDYVNVKIAELENQKNAILEESK